MRQPRKTEKHRCGYQPCQERPEPRPQRFARGSTQNDEKPVPDHHGFLSLQVEALLRAGHLFLAGQVEPRFGCIVGTCWDPWLRTRRFWAGSRMVRGRSSGGL